MIRILKEDVNISGYLNDIKQGMTNMQSRGNSTLKNNISNIEKTEISFLQNLNDYLNLVVQISKASAGGERIDSSYFTDLYRKSLDISKDLQSHYSKQKSNFNELNSLSQAYEKLAEAVLKDIEEIEKQQSSNNTN